MSFGQKLRSYENSTLNRYLDEYDRIELDIQDLEEFEERSERSRDALHKLKAELQEAYDLLEELEDRLPSIAPTRFDVQEFTNRLLKGARA